MSARALLERKLDTIIIPIFDIREATILEAIQLLREASKHNDMTEGNLRERGVNLLLKTISEPPSPEPRITLRLDNLPLRGVIRHLSNLSHTSMHIYPYAAALKR